MPVYKLAVIAALLPAALCAADVWESKPFADWTEKDLQKVLGNSPWARQTRALLSNTAGSGKPPVADASSDGGAGGRGSRNADGPGGAVRLGPAPSDFDPTGQSTQQPGIPVIVRWQTALPVRQAQMRAKYGKEAATSPDAQKFWAQEPMLYVISVAGLPGSIASVGGGDQVKKIAARASTLAAKGKEPLRPVAVEFLPNGTAVDVLVGFPRTLPFTLEDQEVAFSAQIGAASITHKFKLKDMVVRGKLEL
jgi:hypothetical protein